MFSVVMPLYNKEPHVSRAIQSVLNQTVLEWELIVVDDGSTDGGALVVRGFSESRIRYIHQENQGPSEARNRGIAEAKYAYVAFLDADDEWLPHHLGTMKDLITAFPEAGLFAQAYWMDDGKSRFVPRYHRVPRGSGLVKDYFSACKPGSIPVWTSATVVPKAVLQEVGGFPAKVPRGQDLECWSQIALRYPAAFSSVPGAVYYKDTVNRHDKRYRNLEQKLGVELALEAGQVPAKLNRGARLYVQRIRFRRTVAYFKAGDLPGGWKSTVALGFPLSWDMLIQVPSLWARALRLFFWRKQ